MVHAFDAMALLYITLLGGFSARHNSGEPCVLPTRKAQALLAYLALPPGRFHTREKLTALFWGETTEAKARQSFRQALASLRRTLGGARPPALLMQGDAIALNPKAVTVDVAQFETALAEGSPEALERAAMLYQGDLLDGFGLDEAPFEEWRVVERERLHELALEALARLLRQQIAAERAEAAIQIALRILALDPLQEVIHRALMRLYAQQGRRAAALRQYQVCVAALQQELGIEPEAETKQTYLEIVQQHSPPVGLADTPLAERRRLRRRAASAPARAKPGIPLIGRAGELAGLRSAVTGAWDGRGQLVTITGEAGIGKTRLVQEMRGDVVRRGGCMLVGRAHETVQTLPFSIWIDALRTGQVIDNQEIMSAVDAVWRIELARLFPELGAPGLELSTAPENVVRLFEAMTALMAQLTARQPLVIILEDLQWADEMSVRLLAFLAIRTTGLRLVMVATAREEELVDAPSVRDVLQELGRQPNGCHVALHPLSQADAIALAHALTSEHRREANGEQFEQWVWSASAGNPFVVVETVRAIQEGAIPEAPSVRLLPQPVKEMVARRLDRLSEHTQDLLAAAAILGRDFDFALAQRTSGLTEPDAAVSIEELVRRRLLHGVGERFDFTHDRIRDVASGRLLAPRRRLLHAAAGQAMESLYAERLDEWCGQLAYHYGQAGDAEKAIEYLTRSAERAAFSYAHEEALRALQQASTYVDRLPVEARDRRRVDLALRQAYSHMFARPLPDAPGVLLPHQGVVDRLGEPRLAGPYYVLLGFFYGMVGSHRDTIRCGERALAEATRCGDEATLGQAHQVLSFDAFWAGRPSEGIEHGKRAVALLKGRPELGFWFAVANFSVGANHLLRGEFAPAATALTRSTSLAVSIRVRLLETTVRGFLAQLHAQQGDHDMAVALCRESFAGITTPFDRGVTLGFAGYPYLERGDLDEAIAALEESLKLFDPFGFPRFESWFTACLSEAYRAKGQLDRASTLAARSVGMAERTEYPCALGYTQRTLGLIAQDSGRLAEAENHLKRALATFTSIQARYWVGRAQLDLAVVGHAQGHREATAEYLSAAQQLFHALNVAIYVERTRRLASELGVPTLRRYEARNAGQQE